MWEVLLDALLDSLKILPVLFLFYLLVDYFLHKKNDKFVNFMLKNQKRGPLIGSVLGIVPQCGFSAVMADFFSQKFITIGTLIAIMVSTSDEAIILMIAYPSKILQLLLLIGLKIVLAIGFGYLIDLMFHYKKQKPIHDCEHHHEKEEHHDVLACECCEHKVDEIVKEDFKELGHKGCDCCADNIFKTAIIKTLEIFVFLLIANVAIGLVIYFIGEDNFSAFVNNTGFFQPFITSLIGLIPNCFASVFLVQMYIGGVVSFSAMLGGLCAGSGVAMLVLFKKNKDHKQNLIILATMFIIGCLVGLVGFLFGV